MTSLQLAGRPRLFLVVIIDYCRRQVSPNLRVISNSGETTHTTFSSNSSAIPTNHPRRSFRYDQIVIQTVCGGGNRQCLAIPFRKALATPTGMMSPENVGHILTALGLKNCAWMARGMWLWLALAARRRIHHNVKTYGQESPNYRGEVPARSHSTKRRMPSSKPTCGS
jgi:hypothetical protein